MKPGNTNRLTRRKVLGGTEKLNAGTVDQWPAFFIVDCIWRLISGKYYSQPARLAGSYWSICASRCVVA